MKRILASICLISILLLIPRGASGIESCNPPLDFREIVKGKGFWIQNRSKCEIYEFVAEKGYEKLFSWIVADTSIWGDPDFIEYVNGAGADKMYFVSFSEIYPDPSLSSIKTRLSQLKELYGDKMVGAIYDYEFPASERTLSDLKIVFAHARSLCMLFGLVVDPHPERSVEIYGIDYTQAYKFSHFLLPMLYCQWFYCCQTPLSTQQVYIKEREATLNSNLPIVPLVAITAAGRYGSPRESQCDPIITPQQLLDNYSELSFWSGQKRSRPEAIGFFNLSDVTEGHLGAIKMLP
jgi:hypothetical protein